MSTVQFVYLFASILAGVAVAGLLRTETTVARSRTLLAISLAVLIVAIMCVGVVSRTIVRHIGQAIPAVIALILVGLGDGHRIPRRKQARRFGRRNGGS